MLFLALFFTPNTRPMLFACGSSKESRFSLR